MTTPVSQVLFSALRSVFKNALFSEAELAFCSEPDNLKRLLRVSKKHDIDHLVAMGLTKNNIAGEGDTLSRLPLMAAYRYENLNYELTRLCDALECAGIPFIPLKGSFLRNLYPEPWMRTSCDIDVLVKPEDLQRAISHLVNELNYTEHATNTYDVALFTPGKIHIELHFNLVDVGMSKPVAKLLNDVWNYATPKDDFSYWHELSDDMFYFFHIVHMAKHFEIGGCGVRPLIDQWLLDNLDGADVARRDALLKTGGLLVFANKARQLSRVWLDGAPHDSLTKNMQHYILTGGVYGTTENKILVQQQKKGGKFSYIMSRVFLPYSVIKGHYPILVRHPWLTPVMQVRRWFKLLFFGVAKSTIDELRYNQNISQDAAVSTKQLLREIGL